MICDYGCGKDAKYQLKNGKNCCARRPSGCDVLKKIISAKNKDVYLLKKRIPAKLLYQQLPVETKNKMNWAKGKHKTPNENIFVENSTISTEMVKKRIVDLELLPYCCSKCKIDTWNEETIVLELDHINGNSSDNRIVNLRFLCPNCHSQTDTYRGRNKNSKNKYNSDEELLTAYKKYGNIRKALIALGLAAKGGNYERLNKLIARIAQR